MVNRRTSVFLVVLCLFISSPLFAGTRSWTGAVSANWSDPANWAPAGVPTSSDSLTFPAGVSHTTMTNDLPAGASVGSMTFNDVYTLNGNLLTLMGNIASQSDFHCNVDLKIGTALSFASGGIGQYGGAIDVNGQTLTVLNRPELNGPVNGSGTIVADGGNIGTNVGVFMLGGGNFSGALRGGVEIAGSLPDMSVIGSLRGIGTAGTLSANPSSSTFVTPGRLRCCSGSHTFGTLHTKSVSGDANTIWIFNLSPGGVSDQVQVTGTVALSGALSITIPAGAPAPGETFTLIDNDGSDAVSGTFSQLAEGSTVTVGANKFSISYHGGDGNDVVLTTSGGVKSWTGTNSAAWSDPGNWSPAGVPTDAEQMLLFPAGVSRTTMTNDLPAGTSVSAMTFNGAYTLNGNALTLMGNIAPQSDFNCNVDLKIGKSLRFASSSAGVSQYGGAIDVNGQTLTLSNRPRFNGPVNGSGTIVADGGNVAQNVGVFLMAGGTFSGTLIGGVEIAGSLPNMNVIGSLRGNGTVGTLSANPSVFAFVAPGSIPAGGVGHAFATLHTKSISDGSNMTWVFNLTPGGVSDQVQVTGTVALLGGTLSLVIPPGSVSAGQTFTLIDNDGSDEVNGRFAQLPESVTFTSGANKFRISYNGGDGNDVVLTSLTVTNTGISQDANTTQFGDPVAVTATVSSSLGTPTGTVAFMIDGAPAGGAPLQNGVASLPVTPDIGSHTLAAEFHGSGMFADSGSVGLPHSVIRRASIVTVTGPASATYGQTLRLNVTIPTVANTTPVGTVTFMADGATIGTAPLSHGVASLDTAALHAGTRSVTAVYSGDSRFEPATSQPMQVNIVPAHTRLEVQMATPILTGESTLITVSVAVSPASAVIPAGRVEISAPNGILDSRDLAGGAATFSIAPLPPGDHPLVVHYIGSADFESSSASVTETVLSPLLAVHTTRVNEGNHGVGTVSLIVTLSAPVSQPVRVSFATLDGTATEGEDYEKASGVIEFAPGELSRSIELHIIGDTFPEADETFSLFLSDPVNATIDIPSAVIVIVNDDQVPPRRRPSRH